MNAPLFPYAGSSSARLQRAALRALADKEEAERLNKRRLEYRRRQVALRAEAKRVEMSVPEFSVADYQNGAVRLTGHQFIGFIIREVADFYRISADELMSDSRIMRVCRPRQTAMWLAHKLTSYSSSQIAAKFRKDHHTTALNAYERVEARRASSPAFAAQLEYFLTLLSPVGPNHSTNKCFVNRSLTLDDSEGDADDEAGVAEQPNEVSL